MTPMNRLTRKMNPMTMNRQKKRHCQKELFLTGYLSISVLSMALNIGPIQPSVLIIWKRVRVETSTLSKLRSGFSHLPP